MNICYIIQNIRVSGLFPLCSGIVLCVPISYCQSVSLCVDLSAIYDIYAREYVHVSYCATYTFNAIGPLNLRIVPSASSVIYEHFGIKTPMANAQWCRIHLQYK